MRVCVCFGVCLSFFIFFCLDVTFFVLLMCVLLLCCCCCCYFVCACCCCCCCCFLLLLLFTAICLKGVHVCFGADLLLHFAFVFTAATSVAATSAAATFVFALLLLFFAVDGFAFVTFPLPFLLNCLFQNWKCLFCFFVAFHCFGIFL